MSQLPSVRGANLLYLLTMLLVLTVGSFVQARSIHAGLALTEIVLVLAPALAVIALRRRPLSATLQLRWPGWGILALSAGIGIALWPLAAVLQIMITVLTGYSVPTPVELLPHRWGDALLLLFNLVILAPLCEETLFRGVIQRAYERHGTWVSVLSSSLLFAFFHMRLQGLIPLVPVALALGYVVARSRSLYSGIVLHSAYNAVAGIYLVGISMRPDRVSGALPLLAIGPAMVLVIAGLWAFHRRTSAEGQCQVGMTLPRFGQLWPLVLAAGLFWLAAFGELVLGKAPELFAFGQRMDFSEAADHGWQRPAVYRYDVQTRLGVSIGRAECTLVPDFDFTSLQCHADFTDASAWQSLVWPPMSAGELDWVVNWANDTFTLLTGQISAREGTDSTSVQVQAMRQEGGPVLSVWMQRAMGGTAQDKLAAEALLAGEWPWRISLISLSPAYARRVPFVAWNALSDRFWQRTPAIGERYVIVGGAEPLAIPAGNYIAWKVTLGHETAWLDAHRPGFVLKYDDGRRQWVLVGITHFDEPRPSLIRHISPQDVGALWREY